MLPMPNLRVNRKLEKFLTAHKPIKVAVGGRGSGKSIGFGDMLTMKMATERADIYCLREFQDNASESVHRVFKGSIEERLHLEGWEVLENRITAPNGARTIYKGANRTPDSMQSAQGYKYSWFEEAHRASKSSLDKLIPTIIRNPGAECWFSGNPQSSLDAFSQRLIVPFQEALERDGYYEDDIHLIVMVNWRDNPWWNEEQEAIRKWDYENRDRAEYDWIWEGKFNDSVDDAIIKPEWFDASIDAHKALGFRAEGVRSFGFDPADVGNDAKASAFRHGVVVKSLNQWTTGDVDDATHRAYDDAIECKATEFVYDPIGIGSAVKSNLTHKDPNGRLRVTRFVGSEKPKDPKKKYEDDMTNEDLFYNRRAQGYWNIRNRFERTYQAVIKGKYHDPDTLISIDSECEHIPQLRAEMCRVARKRNNTRILLVSKADMKGPSTNLADSVVMAYENDDPIPEELPDIEVDLSYVV